MKKAFVFLALGVALIAPSHADVIYNSSAAFLPHVAGGAYSENFDGDLAVENDAPFSNGVYSYSIASTEGLYFNNIFIGSDIDNDNLVVTFSGAPVTAVGGTIYATDVFDNMLPVLISITLSNGATARYLPTSVGTAFVGFTSDTAISSLTILGAGAGTYLGIDNLIVGATVADTDTRNVPEPASITIMGLGLAGLAVVLRRRAA
jgi:hypothetical protein